MDQITHPERLGIESYVGDLRRVASDGLIATFEELTRRIAKLSDSITREIDPVSRLTLSHERAALTEMLDWCIREMNREACRE